MVGSSLLLKYHLVLFSAGVRMLAFYVAPH